MCVAIEPLLDFLSEQPYNTLIDTKEHGMKLLAMGMILVLGGVGGIEQLPPDASLTDWLWTGSIALMGLLAAAVGVLTMPRH